jgi:hypothetical protein
MLSSPRKTEHWPATDVSFTETALVVQLEDGRSISAPLDWYPRLRNGSPHERSRWRFLGEGLGIHWPDLDEDIRVEDLLAGKRSQESPRSFQQWLEHRAALKQRA